MAIFSRMPAAAVLDPTLPDAARYVLSVIAIFADESGTAWPSVPTIAAGAGMSVRTVQRHVRRLEASGYVSTEKTPRAGGGWGSNSYRLAYPEVDVVRMVTARVTPGRKRRGDSQGDTMGDQDGPPGDKSAGGMVTKSAAVVSPSVAHEQPISNSPTEQPTTRASARDATLFEDLKARNQAILARQEAEQRITLERVSKAAAELKPRVADR